jgi:hypothetical protein
MRRKLSTFFAAGTFALALSTPALAGSVAVARSYAITQPDAGTLFDLQQASAAAQRQAYEGNKDNFAFVQKSNEIDQLMQRMKSGQPVNQQQIDNALQPVWIW